MCVDIYPTTNGSSDHSYLIEGMVDIDLFASNSGCWAAGIHAGLTFDSNLAGRIYTTFAIAPDTDMDYSFYNSVIMLGLNSVPILQVCYGFVIFTDIWRFSLIHNDTIVLTPMSNLIF
ncbi:MAG: hypothetical protein K9M57_09770 [Phycisphaerae bacterium]|nr:hypothetical protein [Phycisphaerae bacterium]